MNVDFYKKDDELLSNSLTKASLVIGPTSSVLIDSLYHEVNYVFYESVVNDMNLFGDKPIPLVELKDERLPIAHTEEKLKEILSKKKAIDPKIFEEFSKVPSDLRFLNHII